MNFKLPKSERLHSDKLIKELFNEGSSFFLYPLKVVFLSKKEWEGKTNQLLISVSKKKIKRATGRNYIKRRIREAYRLNKHLLLFKGALLGFIFVGNPEMSFGEIEPRIRLALEKLNKEFPENQFNHDSKIQ
jgi:ribonuclease P protein component